MARYDQLRYEVWTRCEEAGRLECWLTGKPVVQPGGFRFASQFAHVLPKGRFPRWANDPRNIRLLHPDVHATQEDYPEWHDLVAEYMAAYYRYEDPPGDCTDEPRNL